MGAEPDKPDPPEGNSEQTALWTVIERFFNAIGQNTEQHGVPCPALVAVYLKLIQHADRTGEAFPGIPEIAKACHVKRNTVIAALKRLDELGIIQKQRLGFGGGGSRMLITIAEPFRILRETKVSHTGLSSSTKVSHNGLSSENERDESIPNGKTKVSQTVVSPDPYKVELVPRTLTNGSPDGSPGVSVETAQKGRARKADQKANPLEYPPFALFWTTYPACKYKDAPGRMYPAFQVFRKAEKQPGFNVDNLLTALREAAKQCDNLDFFPAPKAWLESRPWLDGSIPKAPDPEAAKREERLRRTREKLDQETIPE